MADDDRSIRVRLLAEVGNYLDGLKKAGLATGTFAKGVSGHGNAVRADIEKVGHTTLLMSAGVAAGLALSAKAAIDWESAWAGVTKTVDGTASQMADLEEGLRNLANELPATHGEIAAVAEAAGALGIQRGAIVDFTRTMIDLGETTNLTADQAANAMARIANVMQTPQADIDRMGSTLVALGNAGASTESEILELSNRLAAAGAIAGLSEADVLAFGSALSSVGVEAEAGGSALSKVFTTVSDAVKDGGDKLIIFGRVAGLTADQFKAAYEEDAAGAIAQFISGLGEMAEKGESLTPILDELGFADIRVANALKSTATAGELLTEQLELGRQAWEDNTALAAEAEKRYDTFAAKAEIARNQLVDLGIDIGDHLLPVMSELLDVGSNVVRGLGEFEGAAGGVATGLGVIATAGLGAIGIIGTFGPKIKQFHDSLEKMGGLGATLASNLGKATAALGAVGVAVGIYSYVLGKNAERKQDAIDLAKEYAEAIREETGAFNENIDSVTARNLGDWGGSSQLRDLNADFDVLLTGIRESGDALRDLSSVTQAGELLKFTKKNLEEAGLAGTEFGDELLRLREEMTATEYDRFISKLADLGDGYTDGAVLAANLDAAQEGVDDSSRTAAEGQSQLGESLGLTSEEAETAEQAIRDLMDAYRASVDPLFGMLDALDKNREAQGAQADAAAEGAERVKEAQEGVADAQDALNEARKGDDADAITAAQERLADSQERLAEAQADAVITAEEQAAMNRDVAKSALDVESAAQNLAVAIQNGTVDVEVAKGMLADWVEQGRMTADQAEEVGKQFDFAAEQAQSYARDWLATAVADTDEAEAAWDRLLEKAKEYLRLNPEQFSADALQAEKFASTSTAFRPTRGAATGGVVGPMLGRPQSSDTVPTMLTLGEGVVNLRGMSLLGPAGLEALNSGYLTPASSYATTTTDARDQSRTWSPTFVVDGSRSSRQAAGDIEFRMRRIALEVDV